MPQPDSNTASPLTPEQVSDALARYPELGHPIEGFQPIELGLASEAVRLTINNRDYIFKRLPRNTNFSRQQYAAQIQIILYQAGFDCPALLENDQGEGLTLHEGRLHSVQTWEEGSHLASDTRQHIHPKLGGQLGSLLGRMHLILAEADLPEGPEDSRLSADQLFNSTSAAVEMLFRGSLLRPSFYWKLRIRSGKTPFDKKVIKALGLARKIAQHLADWHDQNPEKTGEMTPGHGDINWENILLGTDHAPILLDFDNVRWQPRYSEVASALAILCPDKGPGRDAFLAAYTETGLCLPDPETLCRLVLLKYVRSLVWQLPYWYRDKKGKTETRDWIGFLCNQVITTWDKMPREGGKC